jgi:hypothetical protein
MTISALHCSAWATNVTRVRATNLDWSWADPYFTSTSPMGANKSIERWLTDSPGGVPSPTPVARSIPEALVKPPNPRPKKLYLLQPCPSRLRLLPAAARGPAKPEDSLEERLGTQWVVWAGGIGDVARH